MLIKLGMVSILNSTSALGLKRKYPSVKFIRHITAKTENVKSVMPLKRVDAECILIINYVDLLYANTYLLFYHKTHVIKAYLLKITIGKQWDGDDYLPDNFTNNFQKIIDKDANTCSKSF